jgi:hypothetical protein
MATWKRVAFSYLSGSVRIMRFRQSELSQAMWEDKQETLVFDLVFWTRIIGNILFV